MKANELRLDNWINKSLLDGTLTKDVQLKLSDFANWNNFIFKRIPLTKERLLKWGFEKKLRHDPGKKTPCYAKFSFAITIWEDGRLFYDWIGGNIEVKYAHQVQNIYFDLHGQELESK